MCASRAKLLTLRRIFRIVKLRCLQSAAESGNSIRVTSQLYYRFAFTDRFSFTGERAGETRADQARNRS